MNKIYLILSFVSFGFLMSCQEDEYEQPASSSVLAWRTSLYTESDNELLANVDKGNYIVYEDHSIGAVEHYWYIEEGNRFVKNGRLPDNNASDESLNEIANLLEPADKVSSKDRAVAIAFLNSPTSNIRLYNVYNDSVSFPTVSGDTISSVYDEDKKKWVVDKTFTVNVFDSIIPGIKVLSGGSDVFSFTEGDELGENDTIRIEAGNALSFEDISNLASSRPHYRNFYITDNDNGNAVVWNKETTTSGNVYVENETFEYLFSGLGNFSIGVDHRRDALGEDFNIAKGSTSGYSDFPLVIVVDKSTQPFTITDDIKEDHTGIIKLKFNGDLDDLQPNIADSFTISILGTPATIESIEINEDAKSELLIKITETIYEDDTATMSYDGVVPISSEAYAAPFASFTDKEITPFGQVFLLSEGQFESPLGTHWINPDAASKAWNTVEIVPAPTENVTPSDVVPSGNVLHIISDALSAGRGGDLGRADAISRIDLIEGVNYTLRYKRLVRRNDATNKNSNSTLVRFNNSTSNQLGFGTGVTNDALINVWRQRTQSFNAASNHNGVLNVMTGWRSYGEVYIDDLVISTDDFRPVP